MFDIGFWEMAFIGIIALVVIGPERLPGAAHRVGLWVGKGRRMLNEVMADVKKEMREYDVEQLNTITKEFNKTGKQLKDITQSTADSLGLKEVANEIKQSVNRVSDTLSISGDDAKSADTQNVESLSGKIKTRKKITKKTTKKVTKKIINKKKTKKKTKKKNKKKISKKSISGQ